MLCMAGMGMCATKDESWMTLPTFLGIGVPRGGTTWLHTTLISHPDVYMPTRRKEVRFFDRYYERGLGWYETFFCAPEHPVVDFVMRLGIQRILAKGNSLPPLDEELKKHLGQLYQDEFDELEQCMQIDLSCWRK